MSDSTIQCRRCGREQPTLTRAPIPGPVGAEVLASTCTECWSEWEKMEVMVINEFRLNFMEASAQEILNQQMREFLALDDASDSAPEASES